MNIKLMPAIALAVMCLVTGCASESSKAQRDQMYTLEYQGDYDGYSGWYADYLLLQDCATDYECEVAEARLCESYPERDPLDMQELECE